MRMKCDYCDSRFTEMPEDQVCPNCGAAVSEKEEMPAEVSLYLESPVGIYEGNRAYVEIKKESIVFVRKGIMGSKDITAEIPFNEIVESINRRAYGLWPGVFFIYDKYKKSIVYDVSEVVHFAPIKIFYEEKDNKTFEMIHKFCSACAKINLGKEK